MPKQKKLPHSGQILTTKSTIIEYIREIDYYVCTGLLQYIIAGKENEYYRMTLYKVCSKLWFLSKLVYKNNHNIIVKLASIKYKELLFDGYLETREEIVSLQKTLQFNSSDIDYVCNCLQFIELLWCQMISCRTEQVFISELTYAADYVINRKGNIEPPTFDSNSLFPQNYHDFHYKEYYEKYDELRNW